MKLDTYIRAIKDFPKPGIIFRDITPLLGDPKAFKYAVAALCERAKEADAVVGIESRGFIFGAPVALQLGLPFVPARKPGKLPFSTVKAEYALEYGNSALHLHTDAISAGARTIIIDDLLATGGTAFAAAELVENIGAKVEQFLFAIELPFLKGRAKLEKKGTVDALLAY